MRAPRSSTAVVVLLLTFVCHGAQAQQRIDTIARNPNAAALRRIWSIGIGSGSGWGPIGDVTGDGRECWAVNIRTTGYPFYRVFRWNSEGDSAEEIWSHDSLTAARILPIAGDFYGTGRTVFVAGNSALQAVGGGNRVFYQFQFFRSDSLRLSDTPSMVLDLWKMNPPVLSAPSAIAAANLDGEPGDELIVYFVSIIDTLNASRYPEIWIYRGGAGFQVDSPTIRLRMPELYGQTGRERFWVGRLNDHPLPGLVAAYEAAGPPRHMLMSLFLPRDGTPWIWTEPDRSINTGDLLAEIAGDLDGDQQLDLALGRGLGTNKVVIWRSNGTRKSWSTRALDSLDVDQVLVRPGEYIYVDDATKLGDSAGRYAAIDIAPLPAEIFTGGPAGPDRYWDATVNDLPGPTLRDAGDITGDGWNDALGGYDAGGGPGGVCYLYAGGPYIPTDPLLDVHWVSDGVHVKAIALWPNPAREEVHMAWRGDLRRMPRRYTVYTIDGRLVARGQTASGAGEVLWRCSNAPSGRYLLCVSDAQGHLVATAPLVVAH